MGEAIAHPGLAGVVRGGRDHLRAATKAWPLDHLVRGSSGVGVGRTIRRNARRIHRSASRTEPAPTRRIRRMGADVRAPQPTRLGNWVTIPRLNSSAIFRMCRVTPWIELRGAGGDHGDHRVAATPRPDALAGALGVPGDVIGEFAEIVGGDPGRRRARDLRGPDQRSLHRGAPAEPADRRRSSIAVGTDSGQHRR